MKVAAELDVNEICGLRGLIGFNRRESLDPCFLEGVSGNGLVQLAEALVPVGMETYRKRVSSLSIWLVHNAPNHRRRRA